jgi:exosortase/archaeosortase family protein
MVKLIQKFTQKKEFTLMDLAIYLIFFVLIAKIFEYIPSREIEYFTAWLSSRIFQSFGLISNYGLIQKSTFLSLKGVRSIEVTIIRECTGIHIWGILTAIILPLKTAALIKKLSSIVISAFLVILVNIIRIIFTVYLTAFNVPPLSWVLTNPTISTYHYPISFISGLLGIVLIILIIDKFILPELGDFIVSLPLFFLQSIKQLRIKIK